jgi:glycosyltransferase involved in cell wall biosynthesis
LVELSEGCIETRRLLNQRNDFMRILYISSYYKPAYVYGGPANSISSMCEALARQGAHVTVLTTNANGDKTLDVPLEQPVDVNGVTVHYYPLSGALPRTFFHSSALARACESMVKAHDIVVLETFFTHPTGPAVNACRKWDRPYIIPPRGQLLPWALKQKPLKKRAYMALAGRNQLNHAAGLQCSDLLELDAVKELNLKVPAFVIPNGIETSQWENLPPRGSLRGKLGISDTAPVLLMLGRLHRVKNPELAVEMLGILERKDVHLVFAGPDEERMQTRLHARASTLGCANRVHFTGLLSGSALLPAMADADLFLLTSLMESFGMAAVEALACGLPVLLSKNVPVGRWVDEAGAGRQVACTSAAFAQACDEMLSDESLLKEMGRQARALAFQRFDINRVVKQMLAQYQAILTRGKPLSDAQLMDA